MCINYAVDTKSIFIKYMFLKGDRLWSWYLSLYEEVTSFLSSQWYNFTLHLSIIKLFVPYTFTFNHTGMQSHEGLF